MSNRETDKIRFQYRSDLVKELGEDLTAKIEQGYKQGGSSTESQCYAIHATNGKEVVTGPFRHFVNGYLFAKGEK